MNATVIKIGGALLADPDALGAIWDGVRHLLREGPVVIVHGGGPQATALARRLGHEPRMLAGRRVTTELDRDIVLWTIRGELNATLVANAQAAGVPAVGVSGTDGGLVHVERQPPHEVDGETVDFGWVGQIVDVNPKVLTALLDAGFVPVVAPPSADADGHLYNVNADKVARAIARRLQARVLVFATEAGGVFRTLGDPASRIDMLDAAGFESGVREGWIADGMRLKLEMALEAASSGVPVRICAPADLADASAGTTIVT